jgi:hypothetical protein
MDDPRQVGAAFEPPSTRMKAAIAKSEKRDDPSGNRVEYDLV